MLIVIVLILLIAVFFNDLKQSVDKTTQVIERSQKNSSKTLNGHNSFSVLLLGIDTGAEERVDQGRSDTMILAKVSANKNRSLLVSLPRDTYTEIIGQKKMTK